MKAFFTLYCNIGYLFDIAITNSIWYVSSLYTVEKVSK